LSRLTQKEVCFSENRDTFKFEVKQVFSSIREQLDDHLTAINENTNEIHSNFEALCELNNKVDKLIERIDKMESSLFGRKAEPVFKVKPLTKKEKELFLALYALMEDLPHATYQHLARKLCWTESLVASYITMLIAKGVPIKKRFFDKKAILSIDPKFRQIQAKKNILGIEARLTSWI